MENKKSTHWIWLDKWMPEDREDPVLAIFRKELTVSGEPKEALIRISADSRYKLYINGKFVEAGPSRGDRQIWFYDEVDIAPYLTVGKNILAVQVLRYPTDHRKGNHGIFRTEYPGLYVKGSVTCTDGTMQILAADESWTCKKDKGFHIVSENPGFAPLQIFENRQGDSELKGWMIAGYDDSKWQTAKEYQRMDPAISPGNLQPRTIPYLYRKQKYFDEVTVVRQSGIGRETWEAFFKDKKSSQGNKPILIPAHTKEIVEVSAGEEMTGYLNLSFQGGKGAVIEILQSEGYVQDGYHEGDLETPVKKNRTDSENGHLHGYTDTYLAAGYGTEELEEEYEPFWFRTFRYIRLTIETKDEPLILNRFDYTETGYPLEVKTKAATSDESLKGIWDISERTLRRCMHETYEDCPFYEQLQYAMDARSEILYTYSVAADDRLARKCMDDFKRSQRYDGLLNCSYPCYGANVIPGFSIYYILMLYDHMMYFGDRELLEDHMPTVEGILRFFDRNLTKEGYVDKIGGVNGEARFWSFIDWTPEWDQTSGIPPATLHGPITMESLLYIMGLKHAAKIAEYLGRSGQAKTYLIQADKVCSAVLEHCMGTNGMLTDGPGIEEYSQQTQVFAILTDTIGAEDGRKILEETILHRKEYAQCSVAMAFYLFRALQKTGLYAYTDEYWNIWRRMLEKGATTCIEDEVRERSDCHAWGSLILYELPSVILGVQPAKPGYQAVSIHPECGYLSAAKGDIWTPRGMIHVKWNKENGEMNLTYDVPEGLEII